MTYMKLYVVTLTAVYDHGCLGVFTDLDAALAHCRAQWAESDGHHSFRIDQVALDQPIMSEVLGTGQAGTWAAKRRDSLTPDEYIKTTP